MEAIGRLIFIALSILMITGLLFYNCGLRQGRVGVLKRIIHARRTQNQKDEESHQNLNRVNKEDENVITKMKEHEIQIRDL